MLLSVMSQLQFNISFVAVAIDAAAAVVNVAAVAVSTTFQFKL